MRADNDHTLKYRNDPRSTDELLAHAKTSGAKEWQRVLAKLAALSLANQAEIQAALNRCTSSPE